MLVTLVDYIKNSNLGEGLSEEKTPEFDLICAIILSGIEEHDTEFLESELCEMYCALIGLNYQCIKDKLKNNSFITRLTITKDKLRCSACNKLRKKSCFDADNQETTKSRQCRSCTCGKQLDTVSGKYCYGCRKHNSSFDRYNAYVAKYRLCFTCCKDFNDPKLCIRCRVVKESTAFNSKEDERCIECIALPQTVRGILWCTSCRKNVRDRLFNKDNGFSNKKRQCNTCLEGSYHEKP